MVQITLPILRGQCLEELKRFTGAFAVEDLGWKDVPFLNSPGEETVLIIVCGSMEQRARKVLAARVILILIAVSKQQC